jgi:DNA mismatch repair protein MutL
VRELFYNTPERRKFLKSENTEASQIIDYVSKMALAAPDVRFRMISNGSILFFTQGKGDVKKAIMTVYSPVLANKLSEVSGSAEKPAMTVSGFAGAPSESRKSRRYQLFFVNGRWVRSKTLERAVDEAYSDKLFEGRFPNVFLFLDIDPSALDVNLLPNKTEVRFYDDEAVEDLVVRSIRKALRQPDAAPDLKMEPSETSAPISDAAVEFLRQNAARRQEEISRSSASEYREDYFAQLRKEREQGFNVQEQIAVYDGDRDENEEKKFDFSRLEIVGQVFATYIICRDENCMYIFDQHAAHERILFERFLNAADDAETAVQQLIVPIVIQLSAAQKASAEDKFDLLRSYGFSLEEFGPDSYAVKECPAFLALDEAEGFIASVLEDDAPGKGSGRLGRDAITMRACKAAVKGNDILSSEEIRQLLSDLQNTENPYSCPHGRPTFLTLTLGDIEHMFKRR